ncbi:MAG TPA: hypothetical protein QF564_28905, partial [Pirellulaceae bacterium]|nr:hypothetical protein [Pirellulaceae bacterium]
EVNSSHTHGGRKLTSITRQTSECSTHRPSTAKNRSPLPRRSRFVQAAFYSMDWVAEVNAADAASAVACLEKRFLRVPMSEVKRTEVVDFLESRNWLAVSQGDARYEEMEYSLCRALHLILCTPEYQMH